MELTPADWVAAINRRHETDPAFRRNRIDAARAIPATWFGNPAAAGRAPYDEPTKDDLGLEKDGGGHTEEWLAVDWRSTAPSCGSTPGSARSPGEFGFQSTSLMAAVPRGDDFEPVDQRPPTPPLD